MEYLRSGSKVVMYLLTGIPEEYHQYIRLIKATTAKSMASAIESAFNDREFYQSTWQDQVNWIRKTKNSEYLVQKLWGNV